MYIRYFASNEHDLIGRLLVIETQAYFDLRSSVPDSHWGRLSDPYTKEIKLVASLRIIRYYFIQRFVQCFFAPK